MISKLRFKTIRMKLMIPILCAIIIGAILLGFASYRNASAVIIEAAEGDGMRSAQILRQFMDLIISTAQLDLSAIAMQPAVRPILREEEEPGELEQYMQALMDRHPIYNSMIALNSKGIIVASTSGSAGGDRSDREYFQKSMAGNDFISEVEVSRQTGRLASFISMPVRDGADGPVIGVVMAAVRLEEFNANYVAPVSLLGDYGYAIIVNKSGTIIGHRDEEMLGESIPADLQERIANMNEERIAFEAVFEGVPSILFVEHSHSTDWVPIVVCPLSDFYIRANNLARVDAILTVGVILLLIIIVFLTIHGVTKALSTTIQYANKVSHGALETNLSIQREDEIGILSQSLRDMVASLKHMISVSEQKTIEAEEAAEKIIASITYASKIQRDLLPKKEELNKAFSDHSIIWKPRDIVGGDIYWLKNFEEGTVLCICDCTGHGTSGAMLTMLIVSALESIVRINNCHDPADIIWRLEQRLVSEFSLNTDGQESNINNILDGCDLALLFIANDGSVSFSSGNMPVFICNGKEVNHIKGQRINVGEGKLKSKDDIKIINIPADPNNVFYIASDGLFDQAGGARSVPFGYRGFKEVILENHGKKQADISAKVWAAFENYRGAEVRVDDIELITFKP